MLQGRLESWLDSFEDKSRSPDLLEFLVKTLTLKAATLKDFLGKLSVETLPHIDFNLTVLEMVVAATTFHR